MGFYFTAKAELNTCVGMGDQIPWTAIKIYADTYGLDVEQFDHLVRIIRAMERGIKGERDKEDEAKKQLEKKKPEAPNPLAQAPES